MCIIHIYMYNLSCQCCYVITTFLHYCCNAVKAALIVVLYLYNQFYNTFVFEPATFHRPLCIDVYYQESMNCKYIILIAFTVCHFYYDSKSCWMYGVFCIIFSIKCHNYVKCYIVFRQCWLFCRGRGKIRKCFKQMGKMFFFSMKEKSYSNYNDMW